MSVSREDNMCKYHTRLTVCSCINELSPGYVFSWASHQSNISVVSTDGQLPPFSEIEEDKKILGTFLENFVHVTRPCTSKGLPWCAVDQSYSATSGFSCLPSRNIQAVSLHAISFVVDAAGKTTWLIMGDRNLWSRGARLASQFFTSVVFSWTSAVALTWQEDLVLFPLVVNSCSTGLAPMREKGRKINLFCKSICC